MKTLLSLGLALLPFIPAQAQIFRPSSVATGAIIGAIIGNNSGSLGNNGLRGAAWGAGAGLLLGGFDRGPGVVSVGYGVRAGRPGPAGRRGDSFGVRVVQGYGGRGYYDSRGYYDAPYSYDYPVSYVERWPDYPGQGLVLGGIAGAIIGNNSGSFGHSGARGAAWGAGIGYVLGAIAGDSARIRAERAPAVVYQEVPASQPAPAQAQPQQVTIINNYYAAPSTPMSAANSLFGR